MADNNEKSLGIPSRSHIPRPTKEAIEEEHYSQDQETSRRWGHDFDEAMGNVTLDALELSRTVHRLEQAKNKIDKVLRSLKQEREGCPEELYFDIPFPVPDTTLPASARPSPQMSEWSKERLTLLESLHDTEATLGKLSHDHLLLKEQLADAEKEKSAQSKEISRLEKLRAFGRTKEATLLASFEEVFGKISCGRAVRKIEFEGGRFHGLLDERGKPHGMGLWVKGDQKYTGVFSHGTREGYGKLESGEVRYEGLWRDNVFEGFGIEFDLSKPFLEKGVMRNTLDTLRGDFGRGWEH